MIGFLPSLSHSLEMIQSRHQSTASFLNEIGFELASFPMSFSISS